MRGDDGDRLDPGAAPFDGPLPPAFDRRVRRLLPGEEVPFVAAEWHDRMVLVASGELELVCEAGGHRRFGAGDLLFADGLPLRRLRNPGARTTVLVSLGRRRGGR